MVLALDLSTKCSGWSVFEDTKLLASGEAKAASNDVIARIKKITSQIMEIIQQYPNIETVILEEVRPEDSSSGGNLHTQKVLMWLQASIIFALYEENKKIKIEYVYPSEWRKQCGIRTGRGIKRTSLKQADIDFVKQNYNLDVSDDEADAIGIGHAYVHCLSNEINWG